MIPPNASFEETRVFWNPTIISLPYWASNQYLIVGRIVTSGSHQQNVICEANICYTGSGEGRPENEKPCTKDDIAVLGANGGMRCAAPPVSLDVPPTPAEHCDGEFSAYVNIPGFHDPRIFWSGKGEPLIIVNTQSRYACFGLWIIDLRSVYPSLSALLASSPTFPSLGPLKSYPTLTELTRNPASDRFPIEKNWMLFFPTSSAYIHYEISPTGGRTFAKLLGGGLTTPNLTDPLEKPCLFSVPASEPDLLRHNGTWHQATNSLKAVLCHRSNESCTASPENTVFFSILHRKHENAFGLPMRYERYLFVWASTPPFGALAVSQYPLLLANETATGWSAAENWEGGEGEMWAYFTYTVSIAYAWGRPRDEAGGKNVGFLDDEVVLAIGIDDRAQAFTVVSVQDLLQCMRACPGRGLKSGGEEVSGGESAEGGR
ncbi:MAG: hypothetical protein M1829_000300 [Trizodia sp. TS-e1964]|nr:MAG: hypothetical protein M1829_000300 [Trizodia sp. TS-e1964]